MNLVWKTLLWLAIGVLPGGVFLLPLAMRRGRPGAPALAAGEPSPER